MDKYIIYVNVYVCIEFIKVVQLNLYDGFCDAISLKQ